MPCVPFNHGGMSGIACYSRGPRRRCACGAPGVLLCDWKTPEAKKPTCDRPICARCSTKPAPDKDLCPTHAHDWKVWKLRRIGQAAPP